MTAPLLIATILRPQGPTGVQTHVETFARYLASKRIDASLLTPYDISAALVYPAFAVRRVLAPISRSAEVSWYRDVHGMFLRWALSRRLDNGDPCVIYAQCPVSAEAALLARRNPQQKVVMVVHFNVSQADEWAGQGMISYGSELWRQIRAKETALMPGLDGIVFVSDFMRGVLLKRMPGLTRVPHVVIPNFVDDPEPVVPRTSFRSDLVSIGTLESRKNQVYLLHVLAAARRAGSLLTLTLIGDGPDRAMLAAMARELGVASQVTFAGQVLQAGKQLVHYRAYVHAARMENLPITLIEALSHGRAVFAPPVGGIPEIVEDDREGRLIPLDEAEQAAAIISRALGDQSIMNRYADCARLKFVDRFRLSNNAERLAAFLTAVAAGSDERMDRAGCMLA